MKKFTVNAKICRIPVIDMATGRVIAQAFTPYYDGENLALRYLALLSEDGDEIAYVPFSSLGFMTDVCTMVRMPETPYSPDGRPCTRLIGAPLTAKAGSVSLFSFGTIAETDVDENGAVISLRLNDGHSFLVPREDSPESVNVNDAFATEAFNCMNDSLRVSAPARSEPVVRPAAKKPAEAGAGNGTLLSDPLAEARAQARAAAKPEAPAFTAQRDGQRATQADTASAVPAPAVPASAEEKRGFPFASRVAEATRAAKATRAAEETRVAEATRAASAEEAEAPAGTAPAASAQTAPAARPKRRAWWRNCIAPTVAMFVYFFVYFLFALFLSKYGL